MVGREEADMVVEEDMVEGTEGMVVEEEVMVVEEEGFKTIETTNKEVREKEEEEEVVTTLPAIRGGEISILGFLTIYFWISIPSFLLKMTNKYQENTENTPTMEQG